MERAGIVFARFWRFLLLAIDCPLFPVVHLPMKSTHVVFPSTGARSLEGLKGRGLGWGLGRARAPSACGLLPRLGVTAGIAQGSAHLALSRHLPMREFPAFCITPDD